ncbi:conserved protein of unknown function [uncultured Sphingopyxis sp.]|uniref:Transcriptional regulator-like domain-containing protein n=1 Tax=uncultured Sphingopyxis sp. TaxID=310581 RepID=A0A1Y5PSU9_9SPHN|nr:conserved protein of unknown function [uncultured Sphingopyxis sp.]
MPGPTSHCDWRDPAPYRRLRGIDRSGMMWEWLRRDPAYVAWYTSASRATRDGCDRPGRLAWGLLFRRRSLAGGTRCAGRVGCRYRSRYIARRSSAGRPAACRPVRSRPVRALALRRHRSRGA